MRETTRRRVAPPASVLLAGSLAAWSASGEAQIRPATDAELDSIRSGLILDQIPEWSHRSVMHVQGAHTDGIGGRPQRLDGWVFFRPYLVQDALCTMEASFVTGLGNGDGYDWSVERFSYWSWIARTASECEIDDRSQVPATAVQSSEPIPTSEMAYIVANSDELLSLAYGHMAAAADIPAEARDSMLHYRSDSSFALERIELTRDSLPGRGFAFTATYRSGAQTGGPAVVFSVTPSGFVIHDVGVWTV